MLAACAALLSAAGCKSRSSQLAACLDTRLEVVKLARSAARSVTAARAPLEAALEQARSAQTSARTAAIMARIQAPETQTQANAAAQAADQAVQQAEAALEQVGSRLATQLAEERLLSLSPLELQALANAFPDGSTGAALRPLSEAIRVSWGSCREFCEDLGCSGRPAPSR